MSVTITLPQHLEAKLQSAAEARRSSIEELALTLLSNAVQAVLAPTPEDVVAEIRLAGPTDAPPASDSLEQALAEAPEDPTFDLEVWKRQWSAAEAEMKLVSRANEIAEGRRFPEA